MSQDFMDPELFADFIIEAKEHLETIEPNLLELEKAPDNLSILNDIFRPMHSLKGASGFLGLNKMNALAHKAESVMDELRKGAVAVTSDIMDVILATTDLLRRMIDNLETQSSEGDVDTSGMIAALDAVLAGQTPVMDRGAPGAPAKDAAGTAASDTAKPEADGAGESSAPGDPATGESREQQGAPAETRKPLDTEAWIESRKKLPAYALTAFGEGHLRDFIEEAKDNVSNLSDGLLDLEKHPEGRDDLVNDIFRYFHNLKGNSGIIAFQEMNGLTHEAETLLNSLRKGERQVSGPLVDLLLMSVDVLEALVYCIDPSAGAVTPFDIGELLEKLRDAVAGKELSLPSGLAVTPAPMQGLPAPGPAADKDFKPAVDSDDVALFRGTVNLQFNHIAQALETLRKDGTNRDYIDALFRSLTTIRNCANFMGLEDIKIYAQRTAGIVEKARSANMDFTIMTDLMDQECAILKDLIPAALETLTAKAGKAAAPAGKQAAPPAPAAEKVSAAPQAVAPEKAASEKAAAAAPEAAAKEAPQAAASPRPAAQAAPKTPAQEAAPQTGPLQTAPAATARAAAPQAATAGAPAAHPAPAAKPAGGGDTAAKVSSTIRVDHEKLDHLMNLIGELIINRNRYSMLARQLEETGGQVDVSVIAQNLTETTYSMARISDDLQDTIMKVRMVPVASVFSRFPRLVRDLSRKSGKEVALIVEGEETELDKSVVEVIGDPLVHLIRNSVDHGIEPEAVRRERGKTPQGSVWLRAFYKGNSVAIEIEDDGKGIDPEVMRQVAVRKGIISPEEAKNLDDREATELIFAPGFSSAEVVTDISGRGVGMDVVRTNIKNLKGSINIASEVGKGTKFTLVLPLTLAIIDALMVNVDNETFAIPLDAVSETVKIEAERLTDVKGRKAVTLRGEVLGIISLAEFLGLHSTVLKEGLLNVVVIVDNDRRLGLVVDRLLERQEVVIKPLGSYLGDIKGISGATIMGDGSVILILDPHEIYALATSKTG
ncbi:MAG: Hpt domain-containing protein [Desulfovibrio sp.]|jgi:two-component system chemotaxis sensor kinase CheA|nr:Hpt domain-containing protein [Desulfovibrio sp.]